MSLKDLFCFLLFLITSLFDSFVQFVLPFFDQSFLRRFCLRLELVLRIKFLCQQLVVLFVVLLHMRLQFFRMRFLKCLDCLIIGLKLVKLFFVLLHTAIEATFEFFDLAFIV